MAKPQPNTPVIIGVGDIKNASTKPQDAHEPLKLMLQAIDAAFSDSTLSPSAASKLKHDLDTISVVRTWTWPYPDLPGLLAEHLGANPSSKTYPPSHGGNQPAKLLDIAARRISLGQSKAAIITGGEALASLTACAAAKKLPPPSWTPLPEGTDVSSVFSPTTRGLEETYGGKHGIGMPIQVYPLYENGLRAHLGQSLAANHAESAELYKQFADVAAGHAVAWGYGKPALSAEEIGTVGKKNRMICFPYPLLMNAFNTVNLAAAVILTSAGYARELGVPESQFVYPLGGAGTSDAAAFWNRPDYHSSPAISRSLDAALDVSGLAVEDIDIVDIYSCFPCVPKIAARHLGWDPVKPRKPLTVLGGLTSFGGAGNNYSMHAITTVVRQLREKKDGARNALILANGGVLSYQHVICLSRQPRQGTVVYPAEAPLGETWDVPGPAIAEKADGEAVVETYTVDFGRDGKPKKAHVVGRLKSQGARFLANHADDETLKQLSSDSKEPIGRTGVVRSTPDGKNIFTFPGNANL